ncbi:MULTISPECIES: D-sedoheptulose 7-phosphate isomerase [unclassified Rhodanobacter]|uniref:D-sedoheptulose-7-phosphate isomerase n=1 Tax=unclassified Rhodanobacter TaxID=2621553 RepID=UPI001BDFB880|nr:MULTISPECIES: D-sedoheptulose 7-phosphate isomerase [unclassified Rhodanobacter]MBT2145638.1 D-sedoheptulose 7-phosphate isomerase [Rhodanobacter sp. LX-99]MBT2149683.1 D-sedoheptulose 7-phosphate isomerase [Rhodanobacter sp. LX-100]
MADHLNGYIDTQFDKSIKLLRAMSVDEALRELVSRVVALSVEALKRGNKLLFAGNGGSAADAQHWAGELVSRFNFDRPGLAAIALTTDTSILTAIGNDYGYDYIFARQIEALGRGGDLLFAISTSGNSKNIVRAIKAARDAGIGVIGFTGRGGGAMADLCDVCFRMPSGETPKIQEGHEFLGHLICGLIEHEMFADAKG